MFTGIKNAALKPLDSYIERKAYSLVDKFTESIFNVRPTYSGINVNGQAALYIPAVLQAVRLISETIGSLPCKVYRETADGKEAAKDHTAYRIAHKRANEWTGAGDPAYGHGVLSVEALIRWIV